MQKCTFPFFHARAANGHIRITGVAGLDEFRRRTNCEAARTCTGNCSRKKRVDTEVVDCALIAFFQYGAREHWKTEPVRMARVIALLTKALGRHDHEACRDRRDGVQRARLAVRAPDPSSLNDAAVVQAGDSVYTLPPT